MFAGSGSKTSAYEAIQGILVINVFQVSFALEQMS